MKRFILLVIVCFLLLSVIGCAVGGNNLFQNYGNGSLSFSINLNNLNAASIKVLGTTPTISTVAVTITRDGYATINRNLTVSNNIATGQVTNLEAGYWHVLADVFDQTSTKIYTGEVDVRVIAGVTTKCTILFDPVTTNPTAGTINIEVGLNPLPGYKEISQSMNGVLVANGKIYILDNSANLIGVYNADTLIRIKDIAIPQAPLSWAFTFDKTGIYLGYPSGSIKLLNLTTENFSTVGDALVTVNQIAAFAPNYILISSLDSYQDAIFKTMNVTTGQVISNYSYWYTPSSLAVNLVDNTVYFTDSGVSPADIHRVRLNASTGQVISADDSIYHGDYSLGSPLKIIKNGARLTTSSGNMFSCSAVDADDMKNTGSLGIGYIDLASDDVKGYLYVLGNTPIKKLLFLNQTDYFVTQTIDLSGNPKNVFYTDNGIIVMVEHSGKYYLKYWLKTDLGL